MAMRRSTQLFVLGLAVFVIGAGVVLVSLRGSGGSSATSVTPTTATTMQAGTVVVPSGPGAPSDRAPTTFTIPDGQQAVAVQMPFVAGLAGYAQAGDTVNVYATVEKGQAGGQAPPQAHLVLPGVTVLAMTAPGPGSDGGNATYLLALDANQAEQAIFFSKFESLWLTLVPKGQPPSQTSGRTYKNAF